MSYKLFDHVGCEYFYLKNILDNLNLSDEYNVLAGIAHDREKSQKDELLQHIVPNKKNILIQVSEESEEPFYPKEYDLFHLIFRTYVNNNKIDNKKVFPIPCGTVTRFPWKDPEIEITLPSPKNVQDREYDIVFTGHVNYERNLCIESIRKLTNVKTLTNPTQQFGTGYNLQEYLNLLNNTKISAVPNGFSIRESFRFVESFAAGCIVVTTFPFMGPDFSNIWYYKNCPAIQLSSWNDLNDNIVQTIIKNEQYLFIKSLEYYNDCLSPKAVANYITNKVVES
jgi:hypothetical protein